MVWKRSNKNISLNRGNWIIKILILISVYAMVISCKPSTEIDPVYDATILQTLSTEDQNGTITSLAFSPDGRVLTAGTTVGKVRLWKASDGTLLQTIKAHWCCRIYDISFSPDGSFLVTGVPLDKVLIWKVSDGTLIQTLRGGNFIGSGARHMTSVAYSPDGETIAAGAYDGTIVLWHVSDGAVQHSTMGSWASSSIFSMAFSPDGSTLAVGKEKAVWLIQVKDWKQLGTVRGVGGTIMSVAFDPTGYMLAAGGTAGNTRLINLSDELVLRTFSTNRGSVVWDLAFSPDGQTLAIATSDGKVQVWQLSSGILLYMIEVVEGEVSLAFAPDGQTLAVGTIDGSVQIWSVP